MSYDQHRRRTVYPLDFKPFPGLLVRVRKPSFSALEALTRAVLVLGDDLDGTDLPAIDRMSAWRELFTAFADSLVGWNLTDGGVPVPSTRDAVLAQDAPFLLSLARTWYMIIVLRPPELDEPAAIEQPPEEPEAVEDDGTDDYIANFPTTTLTEPEPAVAGQPE